MVHIAYRGDVWFSDGEWAGSDNLDRAIEGFVVKPGSGIDPSDLEYRGLGGDGTWSTPVSGGEYCGSRGKGTPLRGLSIALTGPLSHSWECEYEARFSDGSQAGPMRQGAECRAASGAALTAVQLWLRPAGSGEIRETAPALGDVREEATPATEVPDEAAEAVPAIPVARDAVVTQHAAAEPPGTLGAEPSPGPSPVILNATRAEPKPARPPLWKQLISGKWFTS